MSTVQLSLAEFRNRRSQRLCEALALYGGDPTRQRLVTHLWSVADTVGADRVAALWVDEYGSGLVHTHCVLDLTSQPPRDSFRIDPLRLSWNEGVPGFVDMPDSVSGKLPFLKGVQSACYVALGSDGMRAWFLTADSRTGREPIAGRALDDLMFTAGEVAALVLHRDLAEESALQMAVGCQAAASGPSHPPGWPVLNDLEGRESENGIDRRIGTRFAVARLLHTMIDEDFVLPRSTLDEKITELRKSFDVVSEDDSERAEWVRLANALEAEDRLELARAVLEHAESVEGQGHFNGARELFRVGYLIAASTWAHEEVIDAYRSLGRVSRRLAEWDDAFRWYACAKESAEAFGAVGRSALTLCGIANTHVEQGNLPLARECLEEALAIARSTNDSGTLGTVHHDVMSLELASKRYEAAAKHGWEAVRVAASEQARIRSLTTLAWVFLELGELTASEDAYTIVAERSEEFLFRVYALDGLACISARRGDVAAFNERLEVVDSLAWRQGPRFMVAELMLYRGKAYRLLGDSIEAESWLRQTMCFCEESGNNQIYFDAEKELRRLRADSTDIAIPPAPKRTADLSAIREGLHDMKMTALAG
ncbi:MAG: tetratricopeptide repeat protein [Longimicrobiales bacterium]